MSKADSEPIGTLPYLFLENCVIVEWYMQGHPDHVDPTVEMPTAGACQRS